jgi:hypothetical protein
MSAPSQVYLDGMGPLGAKAVDEIANVMDSDAVPV